MSALKGGSARTPTAVAVRPGAQRTDRIIGALSWWASAPLLLFSPTIAHAMGLPEVRQEVGRVFAWMALAAVVLAPVAGLVVAQVGERRKERARFLIMATVSSVPTLFLVFLGQLFAECPDGYHC